MRIDQQPTANAAYHAHDAAGISSAQRALIVGYIERAGGSWSIGELAGALSMQKSTVSARLNEAIKAGELEIKAKRKDRLSAITIRPVGLPAKQLQQKWHDEYMAIGSPLVRLVRRKELRRINILIAMEACAMNGELNCFRGDLVNHGNRSGAVDAALAIFFGADK